MSEGAGAEKPAQKQEQEAEVEQELEEEAPGKEITFNVKSSSDSRYVITIPEKMTVLELKNKLATSEYADVEPSRQRLIYSGRVLKDADQLLIYKIKDGNTVHLVKGAASNQRQNPAAQNAGTSSGSASSVPPGAGVPSNIQTGTGTDPLAGLTGARYAGFAQMPGAEQFGPDGGMGPPQGPDEMLRRLEDPMFQSQMNEAMNNPHVIQMMQNSPMVRNNPFLRQMLENPEMRRMMMDPQLIRQSMQMRDMMMGGNQTPQGSMPAPGVTDTTPQSNREGNRSNNTQQSSTPSNNTTGTAGTTSPSTTSPPPYPFAPFGAPGGAQGNPFAALFGGGGGFGAGSNTTNTEQTQTPGHTQSTSPPANPFAGLFGNAGANGQQDPIAAMTQQMMQNPEMMRMAMQSMGLGAGAGGNTGAGQAGQGADPASNPFAMFGGYPGWGASAPPQPADTRPPEEQYAEQLRQLNDMGFYEFDANVRALRRAGGSVQGAIEMLLSGQ